MGKTQNFGLWLTGPSGFHPDTASDGESTWDCDANMQAIDKALASAGFVPPVTKDLYVDNGRADSYTADGSLLKPFKTIQAAVNQVIANGDNSQNVAYTIVVNQGLYNETITLENTALANLSFVANGTVQVTALTSVQSTQNNNQLATLVFTGFIFNTVTLTCPTASGTFLNRAGSFTNCTFATTLTLTNCGSPMFSGCSFNNVAITFTNVNNAFFFGCGTNGATQTMTMVSDSGQPQPSGFAGTYLQIQASSLQWTALSLQGPASGTQLDVLVGSIVTRTTGTVTIQSGALLRLFAGATISGAITVNAGGEFRTIGGSYRGTLTLSGTHTVQGTTETAALVLGGAAPSVDSGKVGLGNGTAASATAGAASLPANPLGFLVANVGGTTVKIPYYNN